MLVDRLKFFTGWLASPLTMGTFIPSSRRLGQFMSSCLDQESSGKILELGPGTGVLTQQILNHGISIENLMLLEYDQNFCSLLKKRYPGLQILQGDAYHLRETLVGVKEHTLAGVISGLPLLLRSKEERISLMQDVFYFLKPGAPFIQFTYGVHSPIPYEEGFHIKRAGWVVSNLPPACVWVCRKETFDAE